MTQFMLLNDLRFFCRKAASFNAVYNNDYNNDQTTESA